MPHLTSLTVYCGSAPGNDPGYAEAARALGAEMAVRGIKLVYGGGRLGLMGALADATLAAGGEVHGVIPEALVPHEVAHHGCTRLSVVTTMHERKAKFAALGDAFLVLPGGIGTLDELFEAWTWNALGYHSKPLCLLDVGGYWDGLKSFLDGVAGSGFLSPARRAQLLSADNAADALDQLEAAVASATSGMVW